MAKIIIESLSKKKGFSNPTSLQSMVSKITGEDVTKHFAKNFALENYGELVSAIRYELVQELLIQREINERERTVEARKKKLRKNL